ncbi:MAG: M42 family metallopeptidase, partial [Clostridiales bacterium]|nr:M42 family metallopeptidase [Clostridiales bacterium]
PVQREVLTMGGNDAGAMQLSRAGVLAGTISVACRYVHSASEAVSLPDLERAAALLVEFLQNPLCE